MVRVMASSPPWSHTHAIAAATTDANVLKATGAASNQSVNQWDLAGSCIVGCTGQHPQSLTVEAGFVKASGAAKVAAVTAIPSVTGAAQ